MVEFWMSALAINPLNRDPEEDLTTPVPKEERVVEPFEATVR